MNVSPHINSAEPRGNYHDPSYRDFLARFSARFDKLVGDGVPLFRTDVADLWDVYISAFPPADRQHHNCNACRSFINHYGSLVVIDKHTLLARSAFWADDIRGTEVVHSPENEALRAMRQHVERARVTGVFLSSKRSLGQSLTGVWRHLSVKLPEAMLHTSRALTASQAMAEKSEDRKNIARALGEFRVPILQQAVALLKANALYRTEKALAPAEWLLNLAIGFSELRGAKRENLIWSAIAKAPAGFCHPRSSMIGTLLEDLEAGLPFDDVAKKFTAKMHPLQYQRPQAAPSAGAIAQAERLVEKLGIARSLERRFARLDEVQKLWTPKEAKPSKSGGVFGHLTPKGKATAAPLKVGATSITWEKFARTVLPDAESIEVNVPSHGNFVGVVTAVHPDAPPILQWDRDEQRNPFSWYVWNNGSMASAWQLNQGWTKCDAIMLQPSMWNGTFEHHGKRAILVVHGQRETRNAGLAIFPEILKGDLHGARSVVEAHSKSGKIQGAEDGSANGLDAIGAHVRVTSDSVVTEYRIDRWD